jgi:hypothetical protein
LEGLVIADWRFRLCGELKWTEFRIRKRRRRGSPRAAEIQRVPG